MTMPAVLRQVKNIIVGYTEAEIKVRNATSNDSQEPSPTLLSEISNLTFHLRTFREVMGMVWYRLGDSGKNWRHVYKALILVDYLLKNGSEQVLTTCRNRISTFQLLQNFQFVDHHGNDRGPIVREKAHQLECLLRDKEGGNVCSPSSSNASDLKEAQPKTSDEEALQLQMALALSMEESEKSDILVDNGPSSEAPPQPSDPSEQPKDDPWDAIPVHCSVPVMGSPWTVLPSSSNASNP